MQQSSTLVSRKRSLNIIIIYLKKNLFLVYKNRRKNQKKIIQIRESIKLFFGELLNIFLLLNERKIFFLITFLPHVIKKKHVVNW